MSQEAKKHPHISRRHLAIYMLIFVAAPTVTYISGKWLDRALSMPSFPPFPLNLLAGLVVFFSGLAIGIKSTRLLFKFGKGLPWGEVNGKSQTQKLVTDGPYAYTRNPMTFGYSLLPCGMGFMFQSIGMTLFIPAITFLAATSWAKLKE
jgi:protein-S-isoprenylcysteine O-methyltransferase Ste14